VVPAKVAVLREGAMKSMMLPKLPKAAVAGLVVLLPPQPTSPRLASPAAARPAPAMKRRRLSR